MDVVELLFLGAALATDAFAVCVCKGFASPKAGLKEMTIVSLYFGYFQAIMPILGYFSGEFLRAYIGAVDYWIIFLLLAVMGCNMIRAGFSKYEPNERDSIFGVAVMLPSAVVTSTDAFITGIIFALLDVNIILAALVTGCMTFMLSGIGIKIGSIFGVIYKKKAQIAGGIVLVLIGTKILLKHLGVIGG